MKKWFIGGCFLVLLLFVVGCTPEVIEDTNTENGSQINQGTQATPEIVEEEVPVVVKERVSCSDDTDCGEGLFCIDNSCGTVEEFYVTEGCATTCRVTAATVDTSDDETYELVVGQGSYSFAGAVAWQLQSTPSYCQGEMPKLPIKLTKKNAGKVVGSELIILAEGATSKVITHPQISRVQFTATLTKATEVCG